jgi:hypothetical protein
VCATCGKNHAALGVEFYGRVLVRRVHGEKQRLRAYGGAFGFAAGFWDVHAGDFDALVIRDTDTGEVWRGDRQAIARVYRQMFDAQSGLQIVVPLSHLERERSGGVVIGEQAHESPRGDDVPQVKQLDFNAMLGRAVRVIG